MSNNYYGTKYTNRKIGYSNEFRQWLADQAEMLVQSQLISLDAAFRIVAKRAEVDRNTVRRAHNALGNAPQARHRHGEFSMPILESKRSHGKYSHEDRYEAMMLAIETSVPKAARQLKICPQSIYDWIKAYGFSSAYFNRK